MRYYTALAAVAIALAGCAQTPAEVRVSDITLAFETKGVPYTVASCIARNVDNIAGVFSSSLREGAAQGSYEVVVGLPVAGSTAAVADVVPTSQGAKVTAFISPHMRGYREPQIVEAMRRCEAKP